MKNPTYMSLFGPTGLLILKKKIQPTWLFGPTRLFGTLEYVEIEIDSHSSGHFSQNLPDNFDVSSPY